MELTDEQIKYWSVRSKRVNVDVPKQSYDLTEQLLSYDNITTLKVGAFKQWGSITLSYTVGFVGNIEDVITSLDDALDQCELTSYSLDIERNQYRDLTASFEVSLYE